MTQNLTWRGAAAEDTPLLFTLFTASKAVEFAPLGLTPQQLQPLLDMQYRARQSTYAQVYPNAVEMILCLEDGTPVGHHLLERRAADYLGVDLTTQPTPVSPSIFPRMLRWLRQAPATLPENPMPQELCTST